MKKSKIKHGPLIWSLLFVLLLMASTFFAKYIKGLGTFLAVRKIKGGAQLRPRNFGCKAVAAAIGVCGRPWEMSGRKRRQKRGPRLALSNNPLQREPKRTSLQPSQCSLASTPTITFTMVTSSPTTNTDRPPRFGGEFLKLTPLLCKEDPPLLWSIQPPRLFTD